MNRLGLVGAGFLGSALALAATRRGWSTTVVARSDPFDTRQASTGPGELRWLAGDGVERTPEALADGLDAIVIAASGHFPVPSSADPAADAIGTLSLVIGLCELVRTSSRHTRIVLLSSAGAVYAPGDELRVETDPGEPTSPYGMSRRVAEEYLSYYRRVHGLEAVTLRCVNIYGWLLPYARGQGVVSAAFRSALEGTPFVVHGNGQQARDFLHVDDFVAVTLDLLACGNLLPPTINVGSGEAHSISAVLEAVTAATGSTITTVPGPSAQTDTGRLAVDLTVLRRLVDFAPMSLADGTRQMAIDLATATR